MSRRTIMAGAAWAVPAVALMSPTPAFAQTSGAPTVTVSGPANGIPASGLVPITAKTTDAQGAPLAGESVYMMGPASGNWPYDANDNGGPYGTTDGAGEYTAPYDNQQPLARPGSTVVLSALARGVTGMKTFTVLGANAFAFGQATGAELGDGFVGPKGGNGGGSVARSIPSQLTKTFPSPIKQIVSVGWAGFSSSSNYKNNATLVLLEDGTVWSIGGNGYGQLGVGVGGGNGSSDTWAKISTLSGVTQLAAGANHVYALLADGTVKGWGDNSFKQVGPGVTGGPMEPTPQVIPGLSGITQLAAGTQQGFFRKNDGTVWALGNNSTNTPGSPAGPQDPGNNYALGIDNESVDVTATPIQVAGLERVTQVAGGVQCGYAVDADGFVWSWGQNGNGKLGDGGNTDRGLAVQIPVLSNVTQIATNLANAYALAGGEVYGWGCGGAPLARSSDDDQYTPVKITGLSGSVSSIGAMGNSAFAFINGVYWGWGTNSSGELGNGDTNDQRQPVTLYAPQDGSSAPTDGVRFTAPFRYSPFVRRNYLIAADMTITIDAGTTATAGASDNTVSASVTSGGAGVSGAKVRFSAGAQNTYFAADEGTTDSSGSFSTTYSADAWLMPGSTLKVSASSAYGTAEATPTVVGANAYGFGYAATSEMGDGGASGGATGPGTGSARGNFSQLQRIFASPIKQIVSCGTPGGTSPQVENSTIILLQDGTVWTIGGNGFGQLGNGNNTGGGSSNTWYKIPSLSGVTQISAGNYHVYALLADGTVRAWGDNAFRQVGSATGAQFATPRAISGLTNVTQISSGTQQGYFLRSNGTVWAIGRNTFGAALGQGGAVGTETSSATPVQVVNLTNVVSIGGGHQCGYAVKSDGTLWAWGGNDKSRLGIGSQSRVVGATPAPDHRSTPAPVQGFGSEKVVQVAGCLAGAIARTASGKAFAWGDNSSGFVGDGTTTDRLVATLVPFNSQSSVGLVTASGGSAYAFVDGNLMCWGDNTWGQLGNGQQTNSSTPRVPYGPVVGAAGLMQHSPTSSRMFVTTA